LFSSIRSNLKKYVVADGMKEMEGDLAEGMTLLSLAWHEVGGGAGDLRSS